MADIEFDCPHCKNPLVVDEKGAFRKVKCPDCGESIVIPYRKPVSAPEQKLSTSTPPSVSLKCPKCGEKVPNPDASFCMMCGFAINKLDDVIREDVSELLREEKAKLGVGNFGLLTNPVPSPSSSSHITESLGTPSPSSPAPFFRQCPKCNSQVIFLRLFSDGSLVPQATCKSCKSVIPLADKVETGCPKCGGKLPQPITRFCMKCGFELKPPEPVKQNPITQTLREAQGLPPRGGYTEAPPPIPETRQRRVGESECPFCGATVSSISINCITCGRCLRTGVKIMGRLSQRRETQNTSSNPQSINIHGLLWIAAAIVAFVSFFHVITGGDVGFKIVPRSGFGFSEFTINVDAITGMPWFMATSKYPIGCKILQREKIIESDEERERRVSELVDQKMEEGMRKAEKLMDESMKKTERQMRDAMNSY